jgi:hypothetical protein
MGSWVDDYASLHHVHRFQVINLLLAKLFGGEALGTTA